MSIEHADIPNITQDVINEAWHYSIENPLYFWNLLVENQQLLASELDNYANSINTAVDGQIDVDEKARELRIASYVYGLVYLAFQKQAAQQADDVKFSPEGGDESATPQAERLDGQ